MQLNRPDYLLQPFAIVRRLRTPYSPPGEGATRAVTPAWGLDLEARSDEAIGYSLITTGVFDLAVTEALLRLTDPGELAVDVGANIGCMTSAMCARVGPRGEVWAFEPSPAVLSTLERVCAAWERPVRVFPIALSDVAGSVDFVVPVGASNGGLARVGTEMGPLDEAATVPAERLDTLLDGREVGVMKVDVERHERQVFAGATDLIAGRRVRDIIYEDQEHYPSQTSEPLDAAGYTIFALGRSFLGPKLNARERVTAGWEEQSYLATIDPERARIRLRQRGWCCLSGLASRN